MNLRYEWKQKTREGDQAVHYRGKQQDRQMSAHERNRGWVFFALFVLVFPPVMGAIQRSIGGELPVAEANVIYYLLSVTLVVLVFWSYLRTSFDCLLDRLPENLFAFATGLVGAGVLHLLVMRIPYPVENPNPYNYAEEYLLAPAATVAILVVLMPIVEEVLFRGLLFGALRGYSRILAWVVSILAYCFYCVWQFVFSSAGVDPRYLLLAIQYVPMSAALTWCYDRGGSVWSAVLLHMAINGFTLVSAVH